MVGFSRLITKVEHFLEFIIDDLSLYEFGAPVCSPACLHLDVCTPNNSRSKSLLAYILILIMFNEASV